MPIGEESKKLKAESKKQKTESRNGEGVGWAADARLGARWVRLALFGVGFEAKKRIGDAGTRFLGRDGGLNLGSFALGESGILLARNGRGGYHD